MPKEVRSGTGSISCPSPDSPGCSQRLPQVERAGVDAKSWGRMDKGRERSNGGEMWGLGNVQTHLSTDGTILYG